MAECTICTIVLADTLGGLNSSTQPEFSTMTTSVLRSLSYIEVYKDTDNYCQHSESIAFETDVGLRINEDRSQLLLQHRMQTFPKNFLDLPNPSLRFMLHSLVIVLLQLADEGQHLRQERQPLFA